VRPPRFPLPGFVDTAAPFPARGRCPAQEEVTVNSADGRALLEREPEREALASLVAAATAGSGCLAVVEGPAGIGKSRLLAEGRVLGERAGMRIATARGSELERQFAFGMVRQLFEPVLAAATEPDRAQLLGGAAQPAAVLLGAAQADGSAADGPTSGGFASLHGLFWLAANLCAQRPLLLCVDDLQWSDAESLRLLAYLVSRLDGLPLLVLGGVRPAEPGAEQHLLDLLTTDPLVTVLRPAPLGEISSATLVRAAMGDVEDSFCMACHAATGGNPLLLTELAAVAAAEGIAPNGAAAARLAEVGPRATGRRVGLRLARLGPEAAALARAVAVFGDGAELAHVAALTALSPDRAMRVADQLAAVEILRPMGQSGLGFAHPLVRAAVYDAVPAAERAQSHARAARILTDSGAVFEQVAAHLLLVPPAGDSGVVAQLSLAARDAFRCGSPGAALTYLERCLREPPTAQERAELLVETGAIAQLVDMPAAQRHLRAAMAIVEPSPRRALIAEMLGRMLFFLGHGEEAVAVFAAAADGLPGEHDDLRRRLNAGIINAAMADPGLCRLGDQSVSQLREAAPDPGVGGRMLDCLIAWHDAVATSPAAETVARALRGLDQGILVRHANGDVALADGCWVLAAADRAEVLPILDTSLGEAHRRGSVPAVAMAMFFQAMVWGWRGDLAESESGCREVTRLINTTGAAIGRSLAAAQLADVLAEQGRLDDASTALDWAGQPDSLPDTAHVYWLLDSRGRLLVQQGRAEEGLHLLMTAGRRFSAHGWTNPAFLAWRSNAAIALLTMGRTAQAHDLAAEELALARQWGAPRALGRALWVTGLATGGNVGLDLMSEAVAVLAPSPARLEHARALVELGAALRRSGRRVDCRPPLRQGVDLAQLCGAAPLVERGRTELRATGARPRRVGLSGPAALTASERRVAELAADGLSNRDIAQSLFVTAKTVEVHLTSTYQKLKVTGRTGLAAMLAE
jgi:DNA-binding CsgD family transcriptional regulator